MQQELHWQYCYTFLPSIRTNKNCFESLCFIFHIYCSDRIQPPTTICLLQFFSKAKSLKSLESPLCISYPWITLAYQEVRLRIGPLAKLGRFKSTADNFLVYIITISLASGPIRSLNSWYAKVLHELSFSFTSQIPWLQTKLS